MIESDLRDDALFFSPFLFSTRKPSFIVKEDETYISINKYIKRKISDPAIEFGTTLLSRLMSRPSLSFPTLTPFVHLLYIFLSSQTLVVFLLPSPPTRQSQSHPIPPSQLLQAITFKNVDDFNDPARTRETAQPRFRFLQR